MTLLCFQIRTVYYIQLISMLAVYVLQFFNPMILGGLLFGFVPAALAISFIQVK